MTKPFNIEIPLVFVGESKAVKELEGTLIKNIDEVEISCLPSELIHQIEVDISSLNTFDDVIRVSDLVVPKTITIKTDLEESVASVVPKVIEEIPVAEEGEPTAEGEEAKEGEPTAEGEEAKEGESVASSEKSKDKKE